VPVADEPAGPVADAAEEPVAEVAADEPVEEMVPAAREEYSSNGRRGLAFFAS